MRFLVETRKDNKDVEKVRDGIPSLIAQRLRKELERRGRVPWGDVELSRQGVHYRP
ncbi:hypothetical protein [Archangium lansingense]|uniref:Uncharacterized protein n=1 Tax=Archangium lansingense TaxID=2995310 RepID=A0ABT4AR72_9BACT|nr:hypothetical protein [Archangium lansinium]MCY1083659.1 hypothetical protein [Archangium lansinium]